MRANSELGAGKLRQEVYNDLLDWSVETCLVP